MEGYPINFEKYNDKGLYVANYPGAWNLPTDVMKLDLHGKQYTKHGERLRNILKYVG